MLENLPYWRKTTLMLCFPRSKSSGRYKSVDTSHWTLHRLAQKRSMLQVKLLFTSTYFIYLLEILLRASEMVQRVKALVINPDDLSSIPGRSEPSPESSLTMACAPTYPHTCTSDSYTHTYVHHTHTK